jgi:protein ImuA
MGGLCQHLEVEALRLQLAQWEGAAWRHALVDPASAERVPIVSSGCPALDRILPEHGFRLGTLVEWLSSGPGDGAATLAFRAAARAADGDGRTVVVVDASGEFYPPAVIAQGIEPARLIVVHPDNKADHTWALDQALRCPAVAAAVAWPDQSARHVEHEESVGCARPTRQRNSKLDGRNFRRLQLAAEQGGGLGLLIRPDAVRGEPSWADVRLLVEPLRSASHYGRPRRMRVVLLRCRGGLGERAVEVEINDESHLLHQAR